jgi:hypothetical protein
MLVTSENKYKWAFSPRFRRKAFGWRSGPPIKRINEALSEIKQVAAKDPILGAEGAVLFLEKVSGALENVDSSSGAIGAAVNGAIETLVPIIAAAPVQKKVREKWLKRLWQAVLADDIPYIENLPYFWGDLCATQKLASCWADKFMEELKLYWKLNTKQYGFYKGTIGCLSALFKAGRYEEILELLSLARHKFWHERLWGVKALLAMGKRAEALRYAEETRGLIQPDYRISEVCEAILLGSGMADEAYRRYAFKANQRNTYLATFRAIVRKYPNKNPTEILNDLLAVTPGKEGKCFAAAKSAGLYDEAIRLADFSSCDPKTLTRAARDMAETKPAFAIEVGLAALKWMLQGYGYEITEEDVRLACQSTIKAAKNAGEEKQTLNRIYDLLCEELPKEPFVVKAIEGELRMHY